MIDQLKEELFKRSGLDREQFEKEYERMTQRTQSTINNVLLIGGAVLAGYLAVRLFTRKRRPSNYANGHSARETPGVMSQIGSILASQAVLFAVDVAKQKFGDYFTAGNHTTNEKPS